MKNYKRKTNKAEIATILTLAAIIFIGLTSVLSSVFLSKKQTTSSKAAGSAASSSCIQSINNKEYIFFKRADATPICDQNQIKQGTPENSIDAWLVGNGPCVDNNACGTDKWCYYFNNQYQNSRCLTRDPSCDNGSCFSGESVSSGSGEDRGSVGVCDCPWPGIKKSDGSCEYGLFDVGGINPYFVDSGHDRDYCVRYDGCVQVNYSDSDRNPLGGYGVCRFSNANVCRRYDYQGGCGGMCNWECCTGGGKMKINGADYDAGLRARYPNLCQAPGGGGGGSGGGSGGGNPPAPTSSGGGVVPAETPTPTPTISAQAVCETKDLIPKCPPSSGSFCYICGTSSGGVSFYGSENYKCSSTGNKYGCSTYNCYSCTKNTPTPTKTPTPTPTSAGGQPPAPTATYTPTPTLTPTLTPTPTKTLNQQLTEVNQTIDNLTCPNNPYVKYCVKCTSINTTTSECVSFEYYKSSCNEYIGNNQSSLNNYCNTQEFQITVNYSINVSNTISLAPENQCFQQQFCLEGSCLPISIEEPYLYISYKNRRVVEIMERPSFPKNGNFTISLSQNDLNNLNNSFAVGYLRNINNIGTILNPCSGEFINTTVQVGELNGNSLQITANFTQ